MTSAFVLDCSAALPWVFQDEASPATDRLLDELTTGAEAWVPALWHLELGNVLLVAQRRRRIDQAGVEAFLTRLEVFSILVDADTVAHAWSKTLDLALLHQLSTYDAAYLELALRRNLPLATLDDALIRTAGIAGVGLCLQG
jgi:predicted nucleic acid-binding protein